MGAEVAPQAPGNFLIDRQQYERWLRSYWVLDSNVRDCLSAAAQRLPSRPLISVIMPSYNIDPKYLRAAIDSVRRQIYPAWELCISDDASTLEGVRELLEACAAEDDRIRITYRASNGHISVNSNDALALASGEYVALMDADDILPDDALFWVAHEIAHNPDVDLLYSDEDKIDESGQRFDPYFKTAWNPALMTAQNAFCHLGVFRRSLVEQVGGFREGYEGAQDHDLVLRCAELSSPNRIRHIPRVLYHWRTTPVSTAHSVETKPYAWSAGCRAIEGFLKRNSIAASVVPAKGQYYQVSYECPEPPPLVSIIVPSTLQDPANLACLQSVLGKTSYRSFELLILAREDHLQTASVDAALSELIADPRVTTRSHQSRPFNFSHVNNIGAAVASGKLLCFLNDDTQVISEDWLGQLVSRVAVDGVGGAGPMLYYPSGRIQHAGVLLGIGGVADHAFRNMERTEAGYFARGVLEQDYSCLTAACLLLRKEAFEAAGGFDETLPAAFNDVDLCIRIRRKGWRLIWTPAAQLYHHESLTFGEHVSVERNEQFRRDIESMRHRWQSALDNDPYYNPNLSVDPAQQFQLSFPPRIPYPPTYSSRGFESHSRTPYLA